MVQILSHTPIWVFALFSVLVVFGLQQARGRNVRMMLAYFFPVGMIVLSLAGVLSSFGIAPAPIGVWAIGLVAMAALCYQLFPLRGIVFSLETQRFFVPGSWVPFVVIMAIFFTKYSVAVMLSMGSPLLASDGCRLLLSFAYGCFSGYFAARAASLLKVARVSAPDRKAGVSRP